MARLMRAAGLRAKKRRRFRVTTQSDHAYAPAPNVLARQFAVGSQSTASPVWAADLTYLPTREGWLYLAVILDLATRRVVGWAVRSSLQAEITVAALEMALAREAPGGLHHSDRGVQYACRAYRDRLATHGIAVSMSRRGDCWDNAVVESFMATLKWELVADADWRTRRQAARDLFEYLEVWYNRQRRHSSLGYQTPEAFARQLANELQAA